MTIHNPHRSISEEMKHKRSDTEEPPPESKKARLVLENNSSSSPRSTLPSDSTQAAKETNPPIRWLIKDCNESVWAKMPPTLSLGGDTKATKTKIGQDLDKLRGVLDAHGLRTTKTLSPREAVSIYKDSCQIGSTDGDGREFLAVTFGVHPRQETIEKEYGANVKNAYCILLFCQKLRQEYCGPSSSSSAGNETSLDANEDLQILVRRIEQTLKLAKEFQLSHGSGISPRVTKEQVNALIDLAANVKGRRCYRKEEWRKEYQRICASNSTISNAYLFLLQSIHGMRIKDIFLKFNKQQPKYERITIYLYDPAIDQGRRPDFLLFLPGLHTIVTRGPHELVSEMIESFWTHVIRNGYFSTTKLQGALEPKLRDFFGSGLMTGNSNNLPLPLKANFAPTIPFSVYLHGKAGAGMFCFSFSWFESNDATNAIPKISYTADIPAAQIFCSLLLISF